MNPKTVLKKKIFLIGCLILFLGFCNNSSAIELDKSASVPPGQEKAGQKGTPYVPGEVLVKFKEGADPALITRAVNLQVKGLERMHPIKPVVNRFKKVYKYNQVTQIPDEEIFKEAYVKMPPAEKSLYRTYKLTLAENITVEAAIDNLRKRPDIEYAEPNYICHIQMVPNDYYYDKQGSWGQPYPDLWGAKKVNCESTWDIAQGEGVIVAVIDTGVDYNHEDISANMWANAGEIPGNGIDDDGNDYIDDIYGFNFVSSSPDPMDDNGHGTHVAGTIAAIGNNNIGIIGVAPKAKIMALKGLGSNGSGNTGNLVKCVIYAADNGARVLNNSWGGEGASQALIDAFHYAEIKSAVALAAAGNNNGNVNEQYPANIDTVVAVAASDPDDQKCDFSNYGPKVEVTAPGGGNKIYDGDNYQGRNILSLRSDNNGIPTDIYGDEICIVNNIYYRARGTSMACPHAAGVAALIASKYPTLSPAQIREKMRFSCEDLGALGKDDYFGYGRLNAYLALGDFGIIEASITSPSPLSYLHGEVQIRGSAYSQRGFNRYELYAVKTDGSSSIAIPAVSSGAVQNGLLALWNTNALDSAGALVYPDGKYDLTLKIIDNYNRVIASRQIKIKIDNVNENPVLDVADKIMVIGRDTAFMVGASDPDDPLTNAGQLAYSVETQWSNYFNPVTRIFSWNPSINDKGAHEVTFTATDGGGLTTQKTINLVTLYIIQERVPRNFGNIAPIGIYNNKVYWLLSYINLENPNIFRYDISHPEEGIVQITTSPLTNYATPFSIDDEKIIWQTTPVYGYYYYDVMMLDLTSPGATVTTLVPRACLQAAPNPSMSGNRVAWNDERNSALGGQTGNSDIYMYDLSTGIETPVSTDVSSNEFYPVICENRIVWHRWYYGDLYSRDILPDGSLGPTVRLLRPLIGLAKTSFDIFKDVGVVWIDNRNGSFELPGNHDVFMYDFKAQKERVICNNLYPQTDPKIYDDRIVWVDKRRETDGRYPYYWDIYMFDLTHNQEICLTPDLTGMRTAPHINKNNIIWYNDGFAPAYERYIALARLYYCPMISAVYPSTANEGEVMTISGNYFGYDKETGSKVIFPNGVVAPDDHVISWSNKEIKCKVPSGAQSGAVKVETLGGISNGIVININNKPILAGIGNQTLTVGAPFTYPLFAMDPDGDTLTYWAVFYNPALDIDTDNDVDPDDYNIILTAFRTSTYDPRADLNHDGRISALDLIYFINRLKTYPKNVTFDNNGGVFNWNAPLLSQVGDYRVTFSAYDGKLCDSETVILHVNGIPTIDRLKPAFGASKPGVTKIFTTVFSDPNGWQDIKTCRFLINTSISGINCLNAYYYPDTNKIYLRNNADTGWAGSGTPGESKTIANSYVKIYLSSTTVSRSGNTVTINWRVVFLSPFAGTQTKNIYLYVDDDYNAYAGFTQMGNWLVGSNSYPNLGTITPQNSTVKVGQPVVLTTTFSDPNSWQDIKSAVFLINTSTSQAKCLSAYYMQNENKIYLKNDAGTGWAGSGTPGQAAPIKNSYVQINLVSTKTAGSGNALTVNWNATFLAPFAGTQTKNCYLSVTDDSNASRSLTKKGTCKISP